MNKVIGAIEKRIGVGDAERIVLKDMIRKTLEDCEDNPGFTFPVAPTEIVICFRPELWGNTVDPYFLGIVAHEISHGITMTFENLGIDENDELRSILIGNVMEEFLRRMKVCC